MATGSHITQRAEPGEGEAGGALVAGGAEGRDLRPGAVASPEHRLPPSVLRLAHRAPALLGWGAFTAGLAFLTLRPLLQLSQRALADSAQGLRDLWNMPGIGEVVLTTVWLGLGSVAVAVTLGTGLALCTARLPRRFRGVLSTIPLVPLVIPGVAAVIGWMFLLSPTVGYVNTLLRELPMFDDRTSGPINVYSVPWIVLITGFSLTSFVYLFVQTGLRNMGDEYQVAAAACGASPARILWTVTLPLLRPSIVYAAGIVLLLGLGQFTAPLILGRASGVDVLTTEMFKLVQSFPVNFGLGAGLGSPLIVAGIAVVVLQRIIIGDHTRFVVARGRPEGFSVEPRWWAAPVVLLYGLFAVVLPLLALVYVSFSPFWSGQLTLDHLNGDQWRAVLDNKAMMDSVRVSVTSSAVAVLIVLPVGFVAAWALLAQGGAGRRIRSVIDLLVTIPLAIPAALLGFGFLFAYTREPTVWYGTATVVVAAYVTLMIPHATRMQLSSLIAMGRDSWEASRASGGGTLRTFGQVVMPQARRGIAATAALMLVLLVHEFTASLMVRSVRTQVMGSILYETLVGGIYPQVAVIALIMVVVTLFFVAIVLAVGGSNALGGS